MIARRDLFRLLAAPAIVRVASLMPVRVPPLVTVERLGVGDYIVTGMRVGYVVSFRGDGSRYVTALARAT